MTSSTLWPGKLPAFAGLGSLRDFDLQFVGVHQIIGGDAEAPGGHLFDRAAAPVAIGIALEARFVLPALAGIGFARRCGSSRWPASHALPC